DTIGNNGGDESETTGLETPAKEVVNKSNGSTLIFLVGYGIGSVVVTGFSEEFQEGDMADTLSRVLEQKVWKIRRSQIKERCPVFHAAANTLFLLPPSVALDITQHPSSAFCYPGRNTKHLMTLLASNISIRQHPNHTLLF
ncbi:hypothetical protein Tco_0223441, partial [Tanacetum coccineum]